MTDPLLECERRIDAIRELRDEMAGSPLAAVRAWADDLDRLLTAAPTGGALVPPPLYADVPLWRVRCSCSCTASTEAAGIVKDLFGMPCAHTRMSAGLDPVPCGTCRDCTRDWTPEADAILAPIRSAVCSCGATTRGKQR